MTARALAAAAMRLLSGWRPTSGKFEMRAPTAQTAVDIFSGRWATNLDRHCHVTGTGASDLLEDGRVRAAADCLGAAGSLAGFSVLELGPLEGAHTFQLEKLGASVVAVESNTEAFLKCLVVKELLNLRSRFLCGDAGEFLQNSELKYDLIFASGILYHMSNPVRLIRLISGHCEKCFLWTHYRAGEGGTFRPKQYSGEGFQTTLYEFRYGYRGSGGFWGGNRPSAAWMQRDEIIRAFRFFGMTNHAVLGEDPEHPAGPAFSVGFWK